MSVWRPRAWLCGEVNSVCLPLLNQRNLIVMFGAAPSPLFAVHQCQRPRVSCERIFDLLSGPLRGAAAIITAVLDTIWNTRFLFKKTPGELNHANKSLAKQYKTWTCSLHGPPSQDDVHAIADSKLRAYAEKVQKSREWPVNRSVADKFADL